MLLLLDNRDSFTFNIAQAFQVLGQRVRVLPARDTDLATIRALAPQRLVIGPGPGTPREAGCSLAALDELDEALPILGICLGHQALALAWGGSLCTSRELVHGQTRGVLHDGRGLFAGLPNPLHCMRYNSLAVDEASLPPELEVSARDENGEIMALRHRTLPQVGVQFHPESILSEHGERLLAAFLSMEAPGPQPND
ncbi:MAG: aminodeoxychorismate/anthranilate synthase component II [Planctomycetota bacterium]|nr:anthranilate/aminodeoxychorismate synthase component II [Planctomycetota bacterium]MDP6368913.1 aminodeoxychorismate/anthranilate synthase component II [Planctomycetota bacterium]